VAQDVELHWGLHDQPSDRWRWTNDGRGRPRGGRGGDASAGLDVGLGPGVRSWARAWPRRVRYRRWVGLGGAHLDVLRRRGSCGENEWELARDAILAQFQRVLPGRQLGAEWRAAARLPVDQDLGVGWL